MNHRRGEFFTQPSNQQQTVPSDKERIHISSASSSSTSSTVTTSVTSNVAVSGSNSNTTVTTTTTTTTTTATAVAATSTATTTVASTAVTSSLTSDQVSNSTRKSDLKQDDTASEEEEDEDEDEQDEDEGANADERAFTHYQSSQGLKKSNQQNEPRVTLIKNHPREGEKEEEDVTSVASLLLRSVSHLNDPSSDTVTSVTTATSTSIIGVGGGGGLQNDLTSSTAMDNLSEDITEGMDSTDSVSGVTVIQQHQSSGLLSVTPSPDATLTTLQPRHAQQSDLVSENKSTCKSNNSNSNSNNKDNSSIDKNSNYTLSDDSPKVKHKPRLLRQAASVMYEFSDRIKKRTSRESSKESASASPVSISPNKTRKSRFTARFRKSSSEPSGSGSSVSVPNDTEQPTAIAGETFSDETVTRIAKEVEETLPPSIRTSEPQSTLSTCSSFGEDEKHVHSQIDTSRTTMAILGGGSGSSGLSKKSLVSKSAQQMLKISKFSKSASSSLNRSSASEQLQGSTSGSQPGSPVATQRNKVKIKVPESPQMTMTVRADLHRVPVTSCNSTSTISSSNNNNISSKVTVSNSAKVAKGPGGSTLRITNPSSVQVRKTRSMEGSSSPPSPSPTSSPSRLHHQHQLQYQQQQLIGIGHGHQGGGSTSSVTGGYGGVGGGGKELPSSSSSSLVPKIISASSARLAASLTSVTNAASETMLAPIAEEEKNRTVSSTVEDNEAPAGTNNNNNSANSNTNNSLIDESLDSDFTAENIFGIHIHNVNRKLKYTKPVLHPVVKVHVINVTTGKYLVKMHPKRNVVSHYETSRLNISNGQLQIDYILPIMTQPCDLVKHIRYPRAPIWEELLLYNEDYEHFLKHEVILFFEVLDFMSLEPSFSSNSLSLSQLYSKNHWWHRVAWAFLRIVGPDGSLRVERKLGLQLYKPVSVAVNKEGSNKSNQMTTELFEWWSQDKKHPFSGSIFVTVKAIPLTQSKVKCKPSLRSLLPFQEEQGLCQLSSLTPKRSSGKGPNELLGAECSGHQVTLSMQQQQQQRQQLQHQQQQQNEKSGEDNIRQQRESIAKWLLDSSGTSNAGGHWRRKSPRVTCKVPIIPWKEFSAGNNRSCYSLKFSNDGSKLACGASVFAAYLSAEKRSSVFIYELPSGTFFRRVNGFHLGTIYDIDWSYDDRLIMSASNDCTVQIWSVEKEKLSSVVLPHPCFIYSCKFCPTKEYLIFTGAYDGLIRLWSVRKCFEIHAGLSKDPELMCEIDAHQGHILSLCFKILPMSYGVPVVAAEDVEEYQHPHPQASSSSYLPPNSPTSTSPFATNKIFQNSTPNLQQHYATARSTNSSVATVTASTATQQQQQQQQQQPPFNNKSSRNFTSGPSSSSHHQVHQQPHQGGGGGIHSHTNASLASEQSNGPSGSGGELVLFSAGSNGTITLWKQQKPIATYSSSAVIFDASLAYAAYHWVAESQIRVPELKNVAINCIKASPIGSKMLVCSRDGLLRMIDYDLEMVVREYTGSQNFSHLIRGSLSPCGNFIFIGSDDGVVHVWDADTGEAVHVYNDLPFKGPVTCVEYHPFENLIAICGLGGRTVSVCLYRHSDLMYGDTDVLQNDQTTGIQRFNWIQNSPENSSNTIKNVDILKVNPSTSHRRPVLQKSITVDHSSSSSHHHHHQQQQQHHGHQHQSRSPHPGHREDTQHQHKHPHHNEESEESTERSRMKRAIRKLETALKMRSLDHS